MEAANGSREELPAPPSHIFERLAQIPGYTWDHTVDPFHSVRQGSPSVVTPLESGLLTMTASELRQLARLRRAPSS